MSATTSSERLEGTRTLTVYDPSSPAPTAMKHAEADDDWSHAYRQGDVALRGWVLSHPPETWSDDVGLLLAMAATYRWEGAAGAWRALPYLERAEALIAARPDTSSRLRASASLLRCLAERSRGDLVAALHAAEESLELLSSSQSTI